MLLTQTGEYALRAMAQMAILPSDHAVRTKDLAEKTHIPVSYLSKIMRRLVAEGLLESEKGHGGGFRFGQSLRRIRLLDILTAVGVEVEAAHCAFGLGKCNAKRPCLLHPTMSTLNDGFRQWAATITLQDIADGQAISTTVGGFRE